MTDSAHFWQSTGIVNPRFFCYSIPMSRSVTLFTGQWADLSINDLLPLVKKMGYDGVELACWGDHFDVQSALSEPDYISDLWQKLTAHGLSCHAISNHLVGQAICDPIDLRHKAILSDEIWGDGDPEGVRQRAAEAMKATARAARKFFDARPDDSAIAPVVNGFTGSSIWHALYAFPPTSQAYLDAGMKTLLSDGSPFSMYLRKWMSTLHSRCIRQKLPSTRHLLSGRSLP